MSTALDLPDLGARAAVLARIRAATRDVPPAERPADVAVPRDYHRADPDDPAGRVDRFVHRVEEYRAVVRRVEPGAIRQAVAESCGRRGVTALVVPADVPADWLPEALTILRDDGHLTVAQINGVGGVLTGCALGIAQTGTIVLDAGSAQGRRVLTLLPDYHLCVVRADQVVGIVPEAVAALAPVAGRPDRPLTWISGPSATSDIELNRVEGVHGPRNLEVLVVG